MKKFIITFLFIGGFMAFASAQSVKRAAPAVSESTARTDDKAAEADTTATKKSAAAATDSKATKASCGSNGKKSSCCHKASAAKKD